MIDLIFSGLESIATVVGAYFIVHQVSLNRENIEKSELIKKRNNFNCL